MGKSFRETIEQAITYFDKRREIERYERRTAEMERLTSAYERQGGIPKGVDLAEQNLIHSLSGSIPEDKIQLLIEVLQNISAGDLNRFWFKKYRIVNIMTGKAFFELCQKVVPWRTEKKWNYENFKKGAQR